MRIKIILYTLYIFWILAGIFLLGVIYFLWFNEYQNVCIVICNYLGKSHKLAEFQQTYLTIERFRLIRYGSVAGLIGYLFLSYLFVQKLPIWIAFLLDTITFVSKCARSKWNLFSTTHKWIAITVITLLSLFKLYQIITIPISYDEAWTYLNFSSKPIFVTLTYYPAPNNHILFTLLTDIFSHLPIPTQIALRLPNWFVLLLTGWVSLLILRDWFSSSTALVGMCLFMISYPVQLYSLQARGYLLYILLGMLAFYLTYKIITRSDIRQYQVPFIVVCVLGFYVMPSFLYVAFSCSVSILFFLLQDQTWKKWKTLFVSFLWIVILTVCLYLPVFLVSGVKSVYDNPYVKRYVFTEALTKLIPHLQATANWLVGYFSNYSYLLLIVIVMGLVVYSISRKFQPLTIISLIFLVCPAVIIMFHKAIPFERTWSYCIFPVIIGLLVLTELLVTRATSTVASWTKAGIGSLAIIYCIWNFASTYPNIYSSDFYARQIAGKSLAKNYRSFYIDNDYFEVLLYYYYTTNHQPYTVDNAQVGQQRDSQKKYDCLILSHSEFPVDKLQYEIMDYGYPLQKVVFRK
ncbi:glycosyltransferase family 39 protein [Cytophagaceae bacterium YF14B1]|uniref:Glycosyltransferase family 39 protein n=1 Tax=Xanthocytophaga flava TaxID=3048013 RepID=A0AAE3U8K2_9BACT|nr:glycosyltransferase family 39 protein [Xanthocytophaga flavus]MDJ1483526.1 glycosyltransferase family 39 protein [Xanthocytophaga flavus]